MKKSLFILLIGLVLFWVFAVTNNSIIPKPYFERTYAATTGSVTLTANVQQYLTLATSSGGSIAFGNLTPGSPLCGNFSTQQDVTTNASNGYTLAVSDGSATNSLMVHGDGTTYIPDMNVGTVGTPVLWVTGTHTGLGLNLFSGTQKSTAAWGTGTTKCDVAFDKWAAVPLAATTGHTVTGYHATADSSFWGWRIDVTNAQKTGIYTGTVLFTSAAVLT